MFANQWPTVRVTRAEAEELYSQRRMALQHFTHQLFGASLSPSERPHDLRGYLKVHGRNGEGHVLATIVCEARTLARRYTRRVRLVPRRPYSVSSTLELRQTG